MLDHRSVDSSSVRSDKEKVKDKKKSARSTRTKSKRRTIDHRFSDFLMFGFQSTVCLGVFVACYALVLVTLWPLLKAQIPADQVLTDERPQDYMHHMHVPPSLKQVRDVAHMNIPKVSEMAGGIKKRLQQLRQGRGVTDAALLDQAKQEFEVLKQQKESNKQQKDALRQGVVAGNAGSGNTNAVAIDERQGFVVLGMHRSGTSMLSGLLHTSCGYTVGGPLIGSAFDNEKGFFERIDVVLQNDEFMNAQGVWWSANVINYDSEKALQDKKDGSIDFDKYGKPALEFLNTPKNAPWLQKDPRMCITLKTWLKLMSNEPAVVFTYRHPLEVAMSLKKREKDFPLEKGLRLWIVYNMRAIQNSRGLCMVKSSNEAILADPVNEVQRISDELTSKCKVPEPPYRLSQEDVDKFIDSSLQHNMKQRAAEEKEVIATYNDGKCVVHNYESDFEDGEPEKKREEHLYGIAMAIFCDFQSGKAYEESYKWPVLA
jgi:hypothetical protein